MARTNRELDERLVKKDILNLARGLCVALVWVAGLLLPATSNAVEVAPRISDREIIESLAELKAGQKVLQQQLTDLKESTQQQIGDLKQQITDLRESTQRQITDLRESTQRQITDLRESTQQQIGDLRQDMNRRFDDIMTLLQILLGTLVLVLGGMLTWLIAIWRKLVRVEKRQKALL